MRPGRSDARARGAAEAAHGDQLEPSGSPFIAHVQRVAAAVPASARRVAWLHDALEWTDLGEARLREVGLRLHEVDAVRLLTRETGLGDDLRFLDHVTVIAVARGRAGHIARVVKEADMRDRAAHPRDPDVDWRPPYDAAGRVLAAAPGARWRRSRRFRRPHRIQEES